MNDPRALLLEIVAEWIAALDSTGARPHEDAA